MAKVWTKPSEAAQIYRFDPYWKEEPEWKPHADDDCTLIRVGDSEAQLLRSNRWASHRARVRIAVPEPDVGRLVIVTREEVVWLEGLVNYAEDEHHWRYFLRPFLRSSCHC